MDLLAADSDGCSVDSDVVWVRGSDVVSGVGLFVVGLLWDGFGTKVGDLPLVLTASTALRSATVMATKSVHHDYNYIYITTTVKFSTIKFK